MATISNVMYSSATPEHYTPTEIVRAVVRCMGRIDLDPCSNPERNIVPATIHYTAKEDGLRQVWRGNVYMNPPYGRVIKTWIEKMIEEYKRGFVIQAIALVPARTDTEWFSLLEPYTVCFVRGRLKFSGDGNRSAAPFPSAIAYLGDNDRKFADVFSEYGSIYSVTMPYRG